MIKFYPFYDYKKADRDGSSFDKAFYYTTVSTQNGYVNEDVFLQSYDSTKYFLINFETNVQYAINLNKQYAAYYGYYPLKMRIRDLNNNIIAEYLQEYYDYEQWWYSNNFFSYFKILNNRIDFYTKNQQQEENIFYSVQYYTSSSSNKFCVSFYPNMSSLNITPNPNIFVDNIKIFDQNNDYNRQNMMFIKKNSDTTSLGLNNKGLFPTNHLVFYFNFQNYKIRQQDYYYYAIQFKSAYGNYTLKSLFYNQWGMQQILPLYLNVVDGYNNKGINTADLSYGIQYSNFVLDKTFQQFTLMCYIKRNQQGYYSWGYHESNATCPDLLGFGYNYVIPNSGGHSQDQSNKNKGFGFYLQNGKIGIRINNLKYIINTDKTYQQDQRQEGRLLNNTWYHICATWDKQYLCGYINGELKLKQKLNNVTLTNATKFYVGTSVDQSNFYNNGTYHQYYNQDTGEWLMMYNYCFQCQFDQMALFDKCLNPNIIKMIYKGKFFL